MLPSILSCLQNSHADIRKENTDCLAQTWISFEIPIRRFQTRLKEVPVAKERKEPNA